MNLFNEEETLFLKAILTLNALEISNRLTEIAKEPNIIDYKEEIDKLEKYNNMLKNIHSKL